MDVKRWRWGGGGGGGRGEEVEERRLRGGGKGGGEEEEVKESGGGEEVAGVLRQASLWYIICGTFWWSTRMFKITDCGTTIVIV